MGQLFLKLFYIIAILRLNSNSMKSYIFMHLYAKCTKNVHNLFLTFKILSNFSLLYAINVYLVYILSDKAHLKFKILFIISGSNIGNLFIKFHLENFPHSIYLICIFKDKIH